MLAGRTAGAASAKQGFSLRSSRQTCDQTFGLRPRLCLVLDLTSKESHIRNRSTSYTYISISQWRSQHRVSPITKREFLSTLFLTRIIIYEGLNTSLSLSRIPVWDPSNGGLAPRFIDGTDIPCMSLPNSLKRSNPVRSQMMSLKPTSA